MLAQRHGPDLPLALALATSPSPTPSDALLRSVCDFLRAHLYPTLSLTLTLAQLV